MKFNKIGVVGGGTMGRGVAYSLAESGLRTVLVDASASILEAVPRQLQQDARLYRLLAKKDSQGSFLDEIELTTEYARLSDVDFVIENVTEDAGIKHAVYRQLDEICKPECILAANTSCISITQIASHTSRPNRVIGLHFMNPVPLKEMVEVMRGYHTSAETVTSAIELLAKMKKDHVTINDMPGFVTNRVMTMAMNEAAFLVLENVATPEAIDRLISKSYGHAMGPLATADLIGLDTILYSMNVLYESFADSKYRPCPLLRKMVDAGLLGRKTGKGFFEYSR